MTLTGWVIRKIIEAVKIQPVPVWTSELIKIPSDANAGDVIFDAGDAIGGVSSFLAPVSGVLDFARLYDRADLGTQLNVVLFYRRPEAPPASDAQLAFADPALLSVLHSLEFTTFKDYINGQYSSVDHQGVLYTLTPDGENPTKGRIYFQAYAPAAQTHVIGSEPQFTISVYPDQSVKD